MVGTVGASPLVDPVTGKQYPLPTAGFYNVVMSEGFMWVDVGPAYVLARPPDQVIRRANGAVFYQLKDTGHGGVFGDLIDNKQVIALVAAIFTAGLSSPAAAGSADTLSASSGQQLTAEFGGSSAAQSIPTIGGSATAASAAGSLISQAGDTSSSTVDQIGSPIGDNIDSASSTIGSTLSDATSTIRDTINDVKGTLSDVFGPIGDVLHSITGTLSDINSSIIQPIVQPLKALIDAQKTLSAAIQRDLHSGVKGLLDLPGSIANAFTSVDATIQRSLAMWAANSGATQSAVFGALLTGEHGAVVGTSAEGIHAALASTAGAFDPVPKFTLGESIDLAAYIEKIAADQEEIKSGTGLGAVLFQWALRSLANLKAIALQTEPFEELWREQLAKTYRIRKFDAGTVQALVQRNELGAESAMEELRVQGYDDERAAALLSMARSLPDTGRILSLFARRWIDNVNATAMLKAQGWDDNDAELLLNSSAVELGPDALLELVRRGLLSADEAAVALERQGFRQFDVARFMETRWRLLGLADLFALHDRLGAGSQNNDFPTLGAEPPEELKSLAAKIGIDEPSARVLWSNHWRLLSPELAVMAYFRGYINAPQLDRCLAQAAIPPELRQNFIDLQRPVIPFRSVSTLVGQGIVSGPEAIDILRSRGFTDRDATWLLEISHKAAAQPQAQAHADLHGLTKQTTLALYDAGTIARDEAHSTLLSLGLAEHAASAELDLHDVRAAHAQRAADIDEIIARARTGELALEDADAQLVALQLSETERAKASARLRRSVRSGLKMPSDVQILGMWKKAIIDDAEALDALQLAGYSELWANRLLELEATRGSKAPGSSGTAGAAPTGG
jgi:hypothetical protein